MDLLKILEEKLETAQILVLEKLPIQVWHKFPSQENFLHHKIQNYQVDQSLLHQTITIHPEAHPHLQLHEIGMMLVTLGYQRVGLLGKIRGSFNLQKDQNTGGFTMP